MNIIVKRNTALFSRIFRRETPPNQSVEKKTSHAEEPKCWGILQSGSNPTTDYYIKPKIKDQKEKYILLDINSEPDLVGQNINKVVIVRYLTEAWAKWLYHHREKFTQVIYFMDDELLRPSAWTTLPKNYRAKLEQNRKILRTWLPRLACTYWTSTIKLQQDNVELNAQVVSPVQLESGTVQTIRPVDPSRKKLIFYHASASHQAEFLWIKPIISEILSSNSDASFEIIGDLEINRMYRNLPRTRILHPMSWPNYLHYTQSVTGGLALAPLLETEFNRARSTVKAYDIERMNADAIFTEDSAYTQNISTSLKHRIVPNSNAAWTSAIQDWLDNKH